MTNAVSFLNANAEFIIDVSPKRLGPAVANRPKPSQGNHGLTLKPPAGQRDATAPELGRLGKMVVEP